MNTKNTDNMKNIERKREREVERANNLLLGDTI
jgi:hypothetical protein